MCLRIRGLVAAVAAALVVLQSAGAAAVTIKASFAPIRVSARPGQLLTTTYELKLQEGEPGAHFKVLVQDWWRSEDGQQSFYAPAGSIDRSCGRWVSLNPGEATVAGGESLKVRLTISVPDKVKPGGYWCALSVDEVPDPLTTTPDGVGVRFLASVSTGIYISIDPIERGADVLALDVAGDRAIARLANTGNTPLTVEGRIEFIPSGASTPTASVDLPRNILLTEPIATGTYAADLPNRAQLPSGRYMVRLVLDIGLDHYIGIQREMNLVRADPTVRGR